MVKNDWAFLGLIFAVVACGGDEGARAASGAGGTFTAGGSAGLTAAGGAAGGPVGMGGVLMSDGGSLSMGGAAAAGGFATAGDGGATSGGGMTGMSGGSAGIGAGGSAGSGAGGEGAGGAAGSAAGGAAGSPPVECESSAPAEFEPNPNIGPGGSQYQDSPHFRLYGSGSGSEGGLNHLEAAYSCFVEDWCFRSTGLAAQSDSGPYYKMNIYSVGSLGGAGGVMKTDLGAGLAYMEVLNWALGDPKVVVHEWGHAMHFSEYTWVDQTRTGAWWETFANWVADTYMTSSYCEAARNRFGIAEGTTIIRLDRVISQSYLLIVSDQNYYEAWPFLTYLTTNPEGYPGLGRLALQNLIRSHLRNNETPLHVLERIAAPVTAQTILGRYWAHMAYLDIGHPQAQDAFFRTRGSLNFANLDSTGNQTYQVKSGRRPQYGGSNIIPLSGTGDISVQITNLGNGRPESNFTATLAIRADSGTVRYVDLPNGSGQATVAANEEASLVVVNTPDMLYQYDAFQTGPSSPESIGLNYQVQITGAVPSN